MLKYLRKGNNCVLGASQQTNKVQCMYLALKDLKIRSKKGTKWSERLKQSKNDVFQG